MRYTKYAFTVPEEKVVRVITDTDAKNEADDQFAVVQALLSPKFENVGLIAAHFGTRVSNGMERSYKELKALVDVLNMEASDLLFHGATQALPDKNTPIDSQGTHLIIDQAMADDSRPLYAIFLGPLTDMASALLMEPRIANRLTIIWIGGGRYPTGGIEFNLGNDIAAANVVFSSSVTLWQIPKNVYEQMHVSLAELEYRVKPQGKVGFYLFSQLEKYAHTSISVASPFRTGETWVLGDSPAVGLILYEHRFEFDYIQAPQIGSDMQYIHTGLNRPIRVYRTIDSRLILEDLYCKLALHAQKDR